MQTFREFVEQINHKQVDEVLNRFLPFAQEYLKLKQLPPVHTISGKESKELKSFGCYDGHSIKLNTDGRHPMDVMRTLAHELVHHAKGHTDGSDGSDHENEANAVAGVIMRKFAKSNPDLF